MATHAHGRELEVRAQLRAVFPDLGASVADEAVEYALRNAEESAEESTAAAVNFVLASQEPTGYPIGGPDQERRAWTDATASSSGNGGLPAIPGGAARLKLAELKRMLPDWDPELLEMAFRQNNLDLRLTLSSLTDAFGEFPADASGGDGPPPSAPPRRAGKRQLPTGASGRSSRIARSVPAAAAAERVVSASCSSRSVHDVAPPGYQEGMGAFYSGRGKLYDLASAASNRGDGQAARELSDRARTLSADMASVRSQIVERMSVPFEYRNSGEEHRLDLHGLTVDEAVSVVRAHVGHARGQLSSSGITSELVFITGRGRHSAHGRPKLYIGVKSELTAMNIAFRDRFDDLGLISVSFT